MLENSTVLENLINQKGQLERTLEGTRETYLKIVGAIEILQQIEETNNSTPPAEDAEQEEEV